MDRVVKMSDTVLTDTCHPTLVQTHRKQIPGVNISGYYGHWVIMMSPRTFISYDHCATLVGDVDIMGVYVGVWQLISGKSVYIPVSVHLNVF